MASYNLNFKGYWIESHISGIPQSSGIYLVYKCTYDDAGVTLKELLYIGKSDNLHNSIESDNKRDFFKKECHNGEILCYSIAEAPQKDLNIIENALIFAQHPKLNDDLNNGFKFDPPVDFLLEGRCKLMKYQNFTIK